LRTQRFNEVYNRRNLNKKYSGISEVKELDAETGLYYYGARYLDPRTSRWLSGDPAMGEYVPLAPINDDARKHNSNLPGLGGVFNYVNLHVYHYGGNNPIKYVDPDGNIIETFWDAVSLGIGVINLTVSIKEGRFVDAAIDLAGIALDTAAILLPGVPGGAGYFIRVARVAERAATVASNTVKLIDGINRRDPAAIAKGSASLTSIVLQTIAGRGFARAANYSMFTKYEDIAHITSAAATLLNGGVLTHDIISTVKESLERGTFFTFSNQEVEQIIRDYTNVIQQPME